MPTPFIESIPLFVVMENKKVVIAYFDEDKAKREKRKRGANCRIKTIHVYADSVFYKIEDRDGIVNRYR